MLVTVAVLSPRLSKTAIVPKQAVINTVVRVERFPERDSGVPDGKQGSQRRVAVDPQDTGVEERRQPFRTGPDVGRRWGGSSDDGAWVRSTVLAVGVRCCGNL